jgi:hypothetical protein
VAEFLVELAVNVIFELIPSLIARAVHSRSRVKQERPQNPFP